MTDNAPTIEQLKSALALAVDMLFVHEPGDSRAVSDEAVALAAIVCGDASPEVMAVIYRNNAAMPPESAP